MKQVIVFPRGQLTDADRQQLTDAGFVAVEADDPSAVVSHIPGVPLVSPDDLFMAALAGADVDIGQSGRGAMVAELNRRLLAREGKKS